MGFLLKHLHSETGGPGDSSWATQAWFPATHQEQTGLGGWCAACFYLIPNRPFLSPRKNHNVPCRRAGDSGCSHLERQRNEVGSGRKRGRALGLVEVGLRFGAWRGDGMYQLLSLLHVPCPVWAMFGELKNMFVPTLKTQYVEWAAIPGRSSSEMTRGQEVLNCRVLAPWCSGARALAEMTCDREDLWDK